MKIKTLIFATIIFAVFIGGIEFIEFAFCDGKDLFENEKSVIYYILIFGLSFGASSVYLKDLEDARSN